MLWPRGVLKKRANLLGVTDGFRLSFLRGGGGERRARWMEGAGVAEAIDDWRGGASDDMAACGVETRRCTKGKEEERKEDRQTG